MNIVNFYTIKTKPSWVKALLYGRAGSGKTRFCADSPNPFYFDFESSTETLRHWEDYSHLPVKKPTSIQELRKDIEKAIIDPEIDTIVIDSITTALDFYMRMEAKKRSQKRDEYVFYEADYKYSTQVFTELFGFLQDAPINVVIIGHERVARDPETGKVTDIYPDVTPRLQQAVTRLVNLVGYMDIIPSDMKGVTRRLYVNCTKVIEAKNRLNLQETYIEHPEWKKIFGG